MYELGKIEEIEWNFIARFINLHAAEDCILLFTEYFIITECLLYELSIEWMIILQDMDNWKE